MHEIDSFDQLDEIIVDNNNNNFVTLLYFGASWCGPCKSLKTKLAEKESKDRMKSLSVIYIDSDKADDIASMYKIKSLPTQIFVRLDEDECKVKVVSRIEGYDYTKLLLEYDNYVENVLNIV